MLNLNPTDYIRHKQDYSETKAYFEYFYFVFPVMWQYDSAIEQGKYKYLQNIYEYLKVTKYFYLFWLKVDML